MSKTKTPATHSPGPWTARYDEICRQDGKTIGFAIRVNIDSREEQDANALLMSKAPEMLDILLAYGEASAKAGIGINTRPHWWTDDRSWQAFVKANEMRLSLLSQTLGGEYAIDMERK